MLMFDRPKPIPELRSVATDTRKLLRRTRVEGAVAPVGTLIGEAIAIGAEAKLMPHDPASLAVAAVIDLALLVGGYTFYEVRRIMIAEKFDKEFRSLIPRWRDEWDNQRKHDEKENGTQ